MVTFIIGLVMLFGGAALYGKLCEKVFGPDDRQTPAYTKNDGVDYVPMTLPMGMVINAMGPNRMPCMGPRIGPVPAMFRRFIRLFFQPFMGT